MINRHHQMRQRSGLRPQSATHLRQITGHMVRPGRHNLQPAVVTWVQMAEPQVWPSEKQEKELKKTDRPVMDKKDLKEEKIPEQQQSLPGSQQKLDPQPEIIRDDYKGSDKLRGKSALITGGDSGIGQAVAVHFAREGANVAIIYLEEDKDARQTEEMVAREGTKFLARSEEHTSELQSRGHLVCRLLLEKKN